MDDKKKRYGYERFIADLQSFEIVVRENRCLKIIVHVDDFATIRLIRPSMISATSYRTKYL